MNQTLMILLVALYIICMAGWIAAHIAMYRDVKRRVKATDRYIKAIDDFITSLEKNTALIKNCNHDDIAITIINDMLKVH